MQCVHCIIKNDLQLDTATFYLSPLRCFKITLLCNYSTILAVKRKRLSYFRILFLKGIVRMWKVKQFTYELLIMTYDLCTGLSKHSVLNTKLYSELYYSKRSVLETKLSWVRHRMIMHGSHSVCCTKPKWPICTIFLTFFFFSLILVLCQLLKAPFGLCKSALWELKKSFLVPFG